MIRTRTIGGTEQQKEPASAGASGHAAFPKKYESRLRKKYPLTPEQRARLGSALAVLETSRVESQAFLRALNEVADGDYLAFAGSFDEFCVMFMDWPEGAGRRFMQKGKEWTQKDILPPDHHLPARADAPVPPLPEEMERLACGEDEDDKAAAAQPPGGARRSQGNGLRGGEASTLGQAIAEAPVPGVEQADEDDVPPPRASLSSTQPEPLQNEEEELPPPYRSKKTAAGGPAPAAATRTSKPDADEDDKAAAAQPQGGANRSQGSSLHSGTTGAPGRAIAEDAAPGVEQADEDELPPPRASLSSTQPEPLQNEEEELPPPYRSKKTAAGGPAPAAATRTSKPDADEDDKAAAAQPQGGANRSQGSSLHSGTTGAPGRAIAEDAAPGVEQADEDELPPPRAPRLNTQPEPLQNEEEELPPPYRSKKTAAGGPAPAAATRTSKPDADEDAVGLRLDRLLPGPASGVAAPGPPVAPVNPAPGRKENFPPKAQGARTSDLGNTEAIEHAKSSVNRVEAPKVPKLPASDKAREHDPGAPMAHAQVQQPPSEPTVAVLLLTAIKLDQRIQCRASLDNATVNQYAKRMAVGDKYPPLDVFEVDGELALADGWHRHAAALKAKLTEFHVRIHHGTRRDAIKFAISANATHGRRWTNTDKRRTVELVLHEFADLSDGAIAAMCWVTQPFVSKVRGALIMVMGSEARTGRDGKKRKVRSNTASTDAGQAAKTNSGTAATEDERSDADAEGGDGSEGHQPRGQSGNYRFGEAWGRIEVFLHVELERCPESLRREFGQQLHKFADRNCV